jgi:hypothetical protein
MIDTPIAITIFLPAPYVWLFIFIASFIDAFMIHAFLVAWTILSIYTSYTDAFKAAPIASVFVTKSVRIVIVTTNLLYTFMLYTFESIRKAIFWAFAFPFLWYAFCIRANLIALTLRIKLTFHTVP